jgi:hypothetical protein
MEATAVPSERAAALWATLDGCERLEGGVVLLEEADQERFVETAATLWALTRAQAGRVIRHELIFYVWKLFLCPWRLLSPTQHAYLVAALQQQEAWAQDAQQEAQQEASGEPA